MDRRTRRRSPPARADRWTPELESIARQVMRRANGYAWMYGRMVSTTKRNGNLLKIAKGMLGAVIGTAGLVSLAVSSEMPLWVQVVGTLVGYAIAIISVLAATWRLDENQANALVAQSSYASLGQSVFYQLALRPRDRHGAAYYVQDVLADIATMRLSCPVIDAGVQRAYKAQFGRDPAVAVFAPIGAEMRSRPSPPAREPGSAPAGEGGGQKRGHRRVRPRGRSVSDGGESGQSSGSGSGLAALEAMITEYRGATVAP